MLLQETNVHNLQPAKTRFDATSQDGRVLIPTCSIAFIVYIHKHLQETTSCDLLTTAIL